MMYQFFDVVVVTCTCLLRTARRGPAFLMPVKEVVQNPAYRHVEDSVADGEKAGEEERGQDHHHRRAVDLLLARPRHPLHLDANVEEVIARAFPNPFLYRQLFSHSRLPPSVPGFRLDVAA